MRLVFALLLTLAIALPGVLHPATIRVPEDQPTIAAGLAAATAGDEVVLSCGTYFENGLMMKSGVTLRSETGDPGCAVIDGSTIMTRAIRFFATSGAHLEGVTIRGAWRGGAQISSGSTVTITRCDFLQNRSNHPQVYGAAIGISSSDVSISDSRFSENWAARGSGIYQSGGGALEISGCEFTFNTSPSGYGYATLRLQNSTGDPLSITSSRFVNTGAVLECGGRPVSIFDCTFEGNQGCWARWYAGTFHLGGSPLQITRCVFSSNTNRMCFGGGETYSFGPTTVIEHCVFHGDSSFNSPYQLLYGGLRAGASVRNSIFSKGRVQLGSLFECGPSISCCTFWANANPLFSGGCAWDTTGVLFSDPMFCDAPNGNFQVAGASPCLPGVSPCGELIGVLGAGCGPVSLKAQSWGSIKNLYR